MNIIDAIKSGRPFRRKCWGDDTWWSPDSMMGLVRADILADDWETKPAEVTITREKLREAYAKTVNFQGLARELGLE